MKTQHTLGPWHWWDRKDGRPKKYDLAKLYGEHGRQILSMYGGEGGNALGTTKEAIANAALIASAPALYEALEECRKWVSVKERRNCKVETLHDLEELIAAALASATPQATGE